MYILGLWEEIWSREEKFSFSLGDGAEGGPVRATALPRRTRGTRRTVNKRTRYSPLLRFSNIKKLNSQPVQSERQQAGVLRCLQSTVISVQTEPCARAAGWHRYMAPDALGIPVVTEDYRALAS